MNMGSLTIEDARNIADDLTLAGKTIRKYIDDHKELSDEDYKSLNDSSMGLAREAVVVTTAAVGLAINDMADAATELTDVIVKAKKKIEVLQGVRRVINLAAGLLDLATALVAKNPGDIVASATKLRKMINPKSSS
jgi:hypothetical protein